MVSGVAGFGLGAGSCIVFCARSMGSVYQLRLWVQDGCLDFGFR